MKSNQTRFPASNRCYFACLLILSTLFIGIVQANEQPADASAPQVAVAKTPDAPHSREVVQEIIKLQEQMGGSIVRDRPGLQGWENRPPHPPRNIKNRMGEPKNLPHPIAALRQAAWQLDCSAHQLESLDLYEQADEMRKLAEKLRLDARARKKALRNEPPNRF